MTTLADVLYALAQNVQYVRTGTTTGAGTTATLLDTAASEASDFYNNGTIFFIGGALAGKTAVITDFTTITSYTFPTQSSAPGASVAYAAAEPRFPRVSMVKAIQNAIRGMGPLPYEDSTLTPVTGTYEFSLPTGVVNVKQVWELDGNSLPIKNKHWVEVQRLHPRSGLILATNQPRAGQSRSFIRNVAAIHHLTLMLSTRTLTLSAWYGQRQYHCIVTKCNRPAQTCRYSPILPTKRSRKPTD